MPTIAHIRNLRYLAAVFALWALGVPCSAIPLDVTVGFDGAVKGSAWTPIAVQMSNQTDEDTEGTLLISQADSSRKDLPVCAANVTLPAHSKKLYHLYAKLAEYGGNLTVALVKGRSVLGTKTVRINPVSAEDKMIVSVGSRSSRLNFMMGETVTVPAPPPSQYGGSSGPTKATIQVGSVAPNMLPDRPAAYDGVDLMVISDMAPSSVNPKSLNAIAMWVASGGTLVVSTGPNYRRYQDAFYRDLLPVRITGAVDLQAAASLSALGQSAFPAGPFAAAKSTLKPGIGGAIATESGVPLVAARNYGAGRVIFIALDHMSPAFRDWNGQTKFWHEMLSFAPTDVPVTAISMQMPDPAERQQYSYGYGQAWQELSSSMAAAVSQSPSVKTPSFNTVGLFLLAYLIVLVPVNYVVLRRRRRLELAWVTTPAIVLIFSFGAYAIGYTMKGGSLGVRQATMVQASSDSRYGSALTYASVFSPARRSYDIEIDDPYALGQMLIAEEDESAPAAYVGEKTVMEGVGMAMWSSKTFEACSGRDLGGPLTSGLVISGGRARGEIRNSTGIDLNHCSVYYGSSGEDIGALRRGDSVKVDISPGPYSGGRPNLTSVDESRKFQVFVQAVARGAGRPVLVGWSDNEGDTFKLAGGGADVNKSTCYLFLLNAEQKGQSAGLAPAGQNLIQNASFELGSSHWHAYRATDGTPRGSWHGGIRAHSGNAFLGNAASGGTKTGGYYQIVRAQRGAKYQAKAWSRVFRSGNPADSAQCKVGIDPTGGTDPGSPRVKWSKTDTQPKDEYSEWRELSTPVVTCAGNSVTVFLHMKQLNPSGWHITCFDDAGVYRR